MEQGVTEIQMLYATFMNDFSIKVKISKNEFLLLSLFVSYSHNIFRIITLIGVAAIGFSVFQIIVSKNVTSLLPLGIILLLLPLIVVIKASSLYDKSKELSEEFICEFNDSHFKVIGSNSIDSITWNKVIKIINLKKYLIIFTGLHSAKLINTKYLTADQKKFVVQKGI
jgi:hypothetical protein